MKYLILLLFPCLCFANEYHFTFNFEDGRMLKLKVEGKNRNDALEKAGIMCGEFFGIGHKDLTDKEYIEILDVCANPSMQ